MKSCFIDEHVNCPQYTTEDQVIEIMNIPEGETSQFFSESNQIIFITEGVINIFCKKTQNKKIKEGELVLIPLHRPCVVTALKDVKLLVLKLNFNITFCDRLPLDLLLEKPKKSKLDSDIGLLKPNQKIIDYADIIKKYMLDDVNYCGYYYDLKIREFLFLIRAYYDKKQVFNFFKPIYNGDFVFSNNVYKSMNNVKTARELARVLGYSLSGFEKKFKRVFDISPYQWMQEQKAKKIYHEIVCTGRTFTEMAFEYGFSSPAHFNDFCKTHLDSTPGALRKKSKNVL